MNDLDMEKNKEGINLKHTNGKGIGDWSNLIQMHMISQIMTVSPQSGKFDSYSLHFPKYNGQTETYQQV